MAVHTDCKNVTPISYQQGDFIISQMIFSLRLCGQEKDKPRRTPSSLSSTALKLSSTASDLVQSSRGDPIIKGGGCFLVVCYLFLITHILPESCSSTVPRTVFRKEARPGPRTLSPHKRLFLKVEAGLNISRSSLPSTLILSRDLIFGTSA